MPLGVRHLDDPALDRARHYATRGGTVPGVVYVIDRAKLAGLGVREHVVADTVYELSITVPEDNEVILVAARDGELPTAAIVETIEA